MSGVTEITIFSLAQFICCLPVHVANQPAIIKIRTSSHKTVFYVPAFLVAPEYVYRC